MRNYLKLAAFGLGAATVLATPATAHRLWMLPSATVLSGGDQWVTVDAAVSNDLFYFEHQPLRLDTLAVTAPDGSSAKPENLATGKYRSTFDLHLAQPEGRGGEDHPPPADEQGGHEADHERAPPRQQRTAGRLHRVGGLPHRVPATAGTPRPATGGAGARRGAPGPHPRPARRSSTSGPIIVTSPAPRVRTRSPGRASPVRSGWS